MLRLPLGLVERFGQRNVRAHVGGVFDDLHRLAVQVEDGVIRCLYPDLLAVLAKAFVHP